MRMEWKRQACEGCKRTRDTYGGRCVPCRQPADRRQLVEHNVPVSTADGMAQFAGRLRAVGKTFAEVEDILRILHPSVMSNVNVTARGFFQIEDKSLVWRRRTEWIQGTTKYSLGE